MIIITMYWKKNKIKILIGYVRYSILFAAILQGDLLDAVPHLWEHRSSGRVNSGHLETTMTVLLDALITFCMRQWKISFVWYVFFQYPKILQWFTHSNAVGSQPGGVEATHHLFIVCLITILIVFLIGRIIDDGWVFLSVTFLYWIIKKFLLQSLDLFFT